MRKRKGVSLDAKIIVIMLTVLFLFTGTVFVQQPISNHKVEIQEATSVSGVYIDLRPYYRKSALNDIDLHFAYETYTIDGSCTSIPLLEKLQKIPVATEMSLLLHPVSGSVLQIEADGEMYLEFADTQVKLWREALFFGFLGLFMYAGSAYLIVTLVKKKI
jgi:hypothetical protein